MPLKIEIRYWDADDDLITTCATDIDFTPDNVAYVESLMTGDNPPPGAPPHWANFDLAPISIHKDSI